MINYVKMQANGFTVDFIQNVNFIQNDAKIVDNFSCLLLLATQESLQNSIGYKVDSLTAEHC